MRKKHFPQWISHRGHYSHQVENTLGAFDEAVNLKFDRLETDLRLTKDGHLVLCHDTSFKRVGGPEQDVWTMTKSELLEARLKYHNKVVFFDDFADRYATVDWIIDIKPEQGEKTVQALKEWAEYHKAHSLLTRQAWFLCWDAEHEKKLLNFLPQANLLANEKMCWRAGLSLFLGLGFLGGIKKGVTYSLMPKVWGRDFFTQKIAKKFHKRGAKVLAYLPSTEKEMQAAVDAEFDYVLTELPPLRRPIFSSFSPSAHSGPRRSPDRFNRSDRPGGRGGDRPPRRGGPSSHGRRQDSSQGQGRRQDFSSGRRPDSSQRRSANDNRKPFPKRRERN